MTSTIKVNTITTESGSTLTVGGCGKTVALASGASQTGFGRTGTVNWQTGSIKTGDFTAANGEGYFVDTSSGTITVTLPSSPSAGNIIGVKDYSLSFESNNCTLARNGSNINGVATNAVLDNSGQSVFLVYVDSTKGWIPTQDDASTIGAQFVAATGGTTVTCGNFKYHTFTGPGTFCVSSAGNSIGSNKMQYLVVAGGGSGAGQNCNPCGRHGGGGGAGGYRCSETGLCAAVQAYPITVGGGGAGNAYPANNGSNSIFSTITSAGGGRAGGGDAAPKAGGPGGSGGGTGRGMPTSCVGAGNTPPVSPPQGNPGAAATPPASNPQTNGGGGGAGAAAAPKNGAVASPGGDGKNNLSVWASATGTGASGYYAGGGGGGAHGTPGSPAYFGAGGAGGGGNGGAANADSPGTAGTANTGGGGGGATTVGGSGGSQSGGAGGSGIVIIKYRFQ
jgi:hypothetical protein